MVEDSPALRSAHRRAKALIVAASMALALTAVVTLAYSAFDEPAATPRCVPMFPSAAGHNSLVPNLL